MYILDPKAVQPFRRRVTPPIHTPATRFSRSLGSAGRMAAIQKRSVISQPMVRAAERPIGASPEKALEPWFDTSGVGGEVDMGPPDSAKARAAQATFQRIVDKYPTSRSAPMARYWVAVIYDYCFGRRCERRSSVSGRFSPAHGALEPYAAKAKRRLAALSK